MKNIFASLLAALLLSSCDRAIEHKYTSANVSEKSLESMMNPIEDEESDPVISKKIEQEVFVIPEEFKQKISLALNENLPIKSILYEAAKGIKVDFQISPDIDSTIIFQAHDRPFIEVLDAICDMADLRYTINKGIIKVVKDKPYTDNFDVQFLNISRNSENTISTATDVSSEPEPSSKKTTDHQTSAVISKTQNDFWQELENGIKIILQAKDTKEDLSYSINKQSGIVTILADSKKNKQVREYIDKIKLAATSQVLIEAKIIEVTLKNEYRRGIDWNVVSKRTSVNSRFGSSADSGIISNHDSPVSLSIKTGKMSSILSALEEFGSMRTISNPRITAMNNQAAVLKVAQNHVYFKLNYDRVVSMNENKNDMVSASSDIKTVPIGLIMFVQPSIDVKNGTITLFLRPTISKLSGTVNDPAVDIAISQNTNAADISKYEKSKIPITEVREISSVMKLNDGEIAVLGGFMETHSAKNKSGVPIAKDIPILGEALSSYGVGDEISELVILIKVRIAKESLQKAADIRLQRFVPDPRPF